MPQNESMQTISDEKLRVLWVEGISGPWLRLGLPWSGDLTTLEAAFLKPRQFFAAFRETDMADQTVALQVEEIAFRVRHIRVPRRLCMPGNLHEPEKFRIGIDNGGNITDITTVSGSAGFEDAYVSEHLDLSIAVDVSSTSARRFSKKVCTMFFGTQRPELETLSAFTRDVTNFDPRCGESHDWLNHSLEVLCTAGYLEHVN